MIVFILGIIVLVTGTVLKRSPEPGSRFGGIVTYAGIGILVYVFYFFELILRTHVKCFMLIERY